MDLTPVDRRGFTYKINSQNLREKLAIFAGEKGRIFREFRLRYRNTEEVTKNISGVKSSLGASEVERRERNEPRTGRPRFKLRLALVPLS